MKINLHILTGLLLSLFPAVVEGQFGYATNADMTVTITNYSGPGGAVVISATNSDGLVVGAIGGTAFLNAGLTSVTIPGSVGSIANNAFGRNPLATVALPASVTNIGVEPFFRCTNLTAINVDTNNQFYSSTNGVLFSQNPVQIIQYPCGLAGAYLVPDGVTGIGTAAFSYAIGLTSVAISDTVTAIGPSAFTFATNLAGVCFAGNFSTNFNLGAFADDPLITNILYVSSASGWGPAYGGSPLGGGIPTFAALACGSNALYGDLQVTITPAAAVSAGAQWQVNNGPAQGSGAIVTNLAPGNYTVAFTPVPGFSTPTNQSVSVVSGATASALGVYGVVQSGALEVTIEPAEAVTNGAMWEVDDGAPQTNGATLAGLTVGNHTVSFSPATNFITPPDQTVAISNRATATLTGTYITNGGATGSLTVVFLPKGISTNAYWQVVGDTNHYTAGSTVTNLSPGNHTISFGPVSNYVAPANQTVTIVSNTVATAAGVYIPAVSGTLTVTLLPPAVVTTARWQVDDVTNLTSGATVTNLSAGYHTVSFTGVAGFATPPAQSSVLISSGVAASLSGIYTQTNASVVFVTNGFGSITHPTPLSPGKPYKATAAPKAKNIFVDWIGGTSQPFTVLGTNTTLAFTNEANLVIEANFMTNVFQGAEGTYIGLFAPASVPRQQTNSGAFTFRLASTGSFSGSLDLGGQMVPMSGKFGVDGAASLTTKATKTVSSLLVDLQLDFAAGTVSGSVTNSAFDAALTGERDIFSAANKTSLAGSYTVVIPGTTNPAAGPFGNSYGTVKVSSSGAISLAGSLADGTALSQSSTLSQSGFWPLYVSLYGGKGSLWGWNYFSSNGLASYPWLSWINTTNSTKTAANRSGFTNQQAVLQGSLYQANQSLPASLTVTLQQLNQPALVISNLSGNANKLVLHTNNATGVISGTFANPADSKQTIKVNGAILQNQTNAAGYFLVTNQSGAFSIGSP